MNEDLLNVMGSFSETALNCIEKQNEEIENLKKENARLKDKLNKINDLLNEPIFEYNNIPCNIENEIIQLKDILKEN